MKASVIIPAYNAQKTIKDLLASLVSQDYPQKDYEVIVVDDGSKDNLKLKLEIKNLIFLQQKHQGAGAARNLGAKKAQGEILVFTDSDCLIPKDWVKNHFKSQEKYKDFGIIGGGVKKPKEGTYLAWADFLSSWFNAHEDLPKQEVKEYLPSLNISVKKEVFEELGGFWEKKLTGEDVDFCFRGRQRGVKILFEPALAVWHQAPTFQGFLKHNFNWGYHASFVRGQHQALSFHWLLSGGFFKALILFLPLVCGYTLYLLIRWWRYQPLRFILCLPLIFFGKTSYALGVLVGSWQKSLKKND
ncbi:MAG: glycosyltransferase [Patescibacteria group bacterium]